MSTQINNATPSQAITPTYESLHYIYASTKSPTGYVISKKRLAGKTDPTWCSVTHDQAEHWISHQLLMKQRQALINNGMSKAEAVAQLPNESAVTLDNSAEVRYTVESQMENAMDINSLSIQELASLQLRIATRINFLLTQEAVQQSYNNDVAQTSEPIAEQAVAPEVEVSEIAPSSAAVDDEPAPRIKRKVGIKAKKNVEAVAAKIEETLCVLSRDEAKEFIKAMKLPIKGNMKCEDLNDAINAFNAGGLLAVPAQYLTKVGVTKQQKEMPKAQEVAVSLAKKQVKSKKSQLS